MKFVLFKKSLETGPAPIYLFDGGEEYFKERGEEILKEKYLKEPSLNFSAFHGENLRGSSLGDLVSAAESFPFMSEKRIVKATDLYPTEKEYESCLKKYFENPLPSTILLIVNTSAAKGKCFDLKKAPNVTWVDCSKADEETVLRWIFTQFKRAGITIDTECCERIMQYCLADMARIAGETEKLIAYAGEDKRISSEQVDEIVYRDTDYKIYEMTNSVGSKNYSKYLSVMNELLEKGVDYMTVLNSLCSYFRNMLEILLLNKTDAETAKVLGMKEYAVKMSRRQADNLGAFRVKECFIKLNQTINGIKNGLLSPEGAVLKFDADMFFSSLRNIGG